MSSAPETATRLCDLCLRTPWYGLPAEDRPHRPHHKSLGELETSAKTCAMCKLVLAAALSHDDYLGGLRDGRGFWTLRSFRHCITTLGETPRETMFLTLFGAERPARSPNFSGSKFEMERCVVMSARSFGMPGGIHGADFTRALKQPVLAPTAVVDSFGRHVEGAKPFPADVIIPQAPSKNLPVWIYGNWWASGDPTKAESASPNVLMGIGARIGTKAHVWQDTFNSEKDRIVLCGSGIAVSTDCEALSRFIPSRPLAPHSGSEQALKQIERWLADCSTHRHCRVAALNPVLPTRVLDVLSSERHVELVLGKGSRGRYIALSHSWGTSSRITATLENVEDLCDGIATSFLPRTFRDAIRMTRQLGIRYLWIDCLCIVQDDPKDWEREAATMGEVYRNAYLTISASHGRDSSAGFLFARDTQPYTSPATASLGYQTSRPSPKNPECCISYFADGQNRAETRSPIMSLHFCEEWLPGSSSHAPQRADIGYFGKDFDPLQSSHLSTRGWTLQERFLSRRTIHFAQDQIFYECDSGIWSEDGYVFKTPRFSFGTLLEMETIRFEDHGKRKNVLSYTPKGGSSPPPLRSEAGWLWLVSDYSRRNLTHAKDKLVALAGLARLIAQETGNRYHAGLWGTHIYEDLCWRAMSSQESTNQVGSDDGTVQSRAAPGSTISEATRPSFYRAPSWSWASLDAAVTFESLSYKNLLASVRTCSVTASTNDPFGQVSSGQLDIEAPLFEVFMYPKPSLNAKHGVRVYIDLGDDRHKSTGWAYPDLTSPTSLQYPCYALFLDPEHAILVRSTGRVSDVISRNRPLPKGGYRESDRLLDSLECRRLQQENPTLKRQIMKPIFDAERIGLAKFVKGTEPFGEDGFSLDADDERIDKYEGVPEKAEASTSAEAEPNLKKLSLDDVEYVSDGSWGPVNKDDPKVWLTVV